MFDEIEEYYRWKKRQTLRERLAVMGLATVGAVSLSLCSVTIVMNSPLTKIARGAGVAIGGVLCGLAATKSYRLVDGADERLAADMARIDLCAWKHAQLVQMATEPQPEPVALLPQSLELFNWQLFNTDPDRWPHIAVLGATGEGKSYTAEWATTWLDGFTIACHPHRKPTDYPGIKAIYSGGRFYGDKNDNPVDFNSLVTGTAGKVSFVSFLKTIELEMDRRYKLYEQGIEDYPIVNVILDEFNTALDKVPEAIKPWTNLITEARKVKIRLICLMHRDSVKSLKIEGDGELRKNLKYVRLGSFAEARAKELKDPTLQEWIKNQNYPVLVEDCPALLTAMPAKKQPDFSFVVNRPSEPAESPNELRTIREQLELLWNKDSGDSEFPPNHSLTPLQRERINSIRELRAKGVISKNKILKEVWGASPGDNQPYKIAKEEYEFLTRYLSDS